MYPGKVHCAVTLVLVYNLIFFAVNILAMRTWRVWFLYFASREKVESEQRIAAKEVLTDAMFWFTDRRRFVKSAFLWKVIMGVSFLEIVITDAIFVYDTSQQDLDMYDPRCSSLDRTNAVTLIAAGEPLVVSGTSLPVPHDRRTHPPSDKIGRVKSILRKLWYFAISVRSVRSPWYQSNDLILGTTLTSF